MSLIKWFDSLRSTNTYAKEHINEFENLSVIATYEQSAGRGQGDHTWYATPGKNLTFSIVYKPTKLPASEALYLTKITTCALLSYLEKKGVKAKIKWHNDIWVEDKKICGMLIENILEGNFVKYSVIGIGLDINEKGWPTSLPNPVSLCELTGIEYDIKEELELLHKEFCHHANLLSSEDGKTYLSKVFSENLYKLGDNGVLEKMDI